MRISHMGTHQEAGTSQERSSIPLRQRIHMLDIHPPVWQLPAACIRRDRACSSGAIAKHMPGGAHSRSVDQHIPRDANVSVCGAAPRHTDLLAPSAPRARMRRASLLGAEALGDACGCLRSGQESGAATVVTMRATVQRRSSLRDPFHLGTSGKGREAGSPSAGYPQSGQYERPGARRCL